jgi:hypothetical protein
LVRSYLLPSWESVLRKKEKTVVELGIITSVINMPLSPTSLKKYYRFKRGAEIIDLEYLNIVLYVLRNSE